MNAEKLLAAFEKSCESAPQYIIDDAPFFEHVVIDGNFDFNRIADLLNEADSVASQHGGKTNGDA